MKRFGIMVVLIVVFAGRMTAVSAEPSYAKWGQLAMKETAKRYQADIVDYKHLGRQTEQAGLLSENFRLLLSDGGRKFEVTVRIYFKPDSEQVMRIQFTESGRGQ
ncbi:DUF3889 domain-containing protein [Paenibacillus sp. R14(2021)]|uniref:DUF3889 domain-containing protein n=1 Tax=Paenibacillus sp. R14(2021) TaxID=2859228 RepID=UPI001C615BD5|nr:DUF3889 domain-containing protein [Paenibacillus sp. R14(2021)]